MSPSVASSPIIIVVFNREQFGLEEETDEWRRRSSPAVALLSAAVRCEHRWFTEHQYRQCCLLLTRVCGREQCLPPSPFQECRKGAAPSPSSAKARARIMLTRSKRLSGWVTETASVNNLMQAASLQRYK